MNLQLLNIILATYFSIIKTESVLSTEAPKVTCPQLKYLGVLPGNGWDDLRSIEMSPVLAPATYSQCKRTNDGQYSLPDHVFTIPLKTSDVQLFSEIIDNWSNYSSLTSSSMKISAGTSFLSLKGSFSEDYQTTKQRQVDDKSITTRVSGRYTLYRIGVHATNNIHPELYSALYDAIDAIEKNNTNKADLILELIVRDYGTHFITRVDAGAILVKEDFILTSFMNLFVDNKQAVKATASASFNNVFKFDASYSSTVDVQTKTSYSAATTSSNVKTFGGQLYKPNMTLDEWIDTIDKNLVAIDRSGDPLHFLITPAAFPNISIDTVLELRNELEQAITDYYNYNSHKGCMDLGSPNFDYDANIGKTCDPSPNNFTFGGIYQTCTMNPGFAEDICAKNQLYQKNIVTGDFSCKTPYKAVPLKTGSVEKTPLRCWEECHRVWFHHDCKTVCESRSIATYTAYWCAALSRPVPVNSGMMYGGLFTSSNDNPVTQAKSCPPTFFDVKILQELHICLGNDYELGTKFSIDFGGFFSCQNGNPLYDVLKTMLRSSNFLNSVNTDELLKSCPKEYTQHTAIIQDDCLVYYCVKAGSFRVHGTLPIVLPPFRNYTYIVESKLKHTPTNNGQSTTTSSITILGVVIGLLSALIPMVVVIIVLKLKNRRQGLAVNSQVVAGDAETEQLIQTEDSDDGVLSA